MQDARSGIDLPGVEQVAFVVEDLEASLQQYVDLLSVGPWTVYDVAPDDVDGGTYRGEPADFGMRYGLASVGETMLEVIEPTAGPNIYRDHLDERGAGVHHLAYFSWDESATRAAVSRLERAGIEVLQSGTLDGTEFWYFDTREQLGTIFETAIRRNVASREYETYPPDADPSLLTR